MKTRDVIAALQKHDPSGEIDVRIRDAESDEYELVECVVVEPGVPFVMLCSCDCDGLVDVPDDEVADG